MVNSASSPIADAAANAFNGVVDGLVIQKVTQMALPDLKGFGGILHTGDNQQVDAIRGGGISRSGDISLT